MTNSLKAVRQRAMAVRQRAMDVRQRAMPVRQRSMAVRQRVIGPDFETCEALSPVFDRLKFWVF